MPEEHSSDLVRRFVLQTASREERRAVVAHLLSGCARCKAWLQAHFAGHCHPDEEYEQPIRRAAALANERLQARVLASESLNRLKARNSRKFASLGLCLDLVDKCRALRGSDIPGMLDTAKLAVAVGDQLCSLDDRANHRDAAAMAYGELGNALRANGEFSLAALALQKAKEHYRAGTGARRLLGLLCEQEGVLLETTHHLDEAIKLFDLAAEIYRALGDSDSLARVLIEKGVAVGWSSDPKEALKILASASDYLDCRNVNLLRAWLHDSLWFYLEVGNTQAASHVYARAKPVFEGAGPELRRRFLWAEARLLVLLGNLEIAEHQLRSLIDHYLSCNQQWTAALVLFDLEVCFAKTNRFEDLQKAASLQVAMLGELGVPRETLRAVALLIKSSRSRVGELISLILVTRRRVANSSTVGGGAARHLC